MSVAFGIIEYKIDDLDAIACGVSHDDNEMIKALTSNVYDKIYDITGNNELIDTILLGVADTGFKKDKLLSIFGCKDYVIDWEVGEAYAQAYLEDNYSSLLPWNLRRDIKKPGSSLPGADIVGLHENGDSTYFLFGEIKTSSDKDYPPNLMYGPTGLKKQLEDLCLEQDLILALIRYLGFRLKNTEYWSMYQKAFKEYYANNNNIHIMGVLIRDVKPNSKDLEARVKALNPYCIDGRQINLVAIYLPEKAISRFVSIIESEHERRELPDKC
ncbi:MAG: hypothetical protein AB7V48_07140 [Sedimentibacter sp.]